MKTFEFITKRVKKGAYFSILFIIMSVYFYFNNAYDLTITCLLISLILISSYFGLFLFKKYKKTKENY